MQSEDRYNHSHRWFTVLATTDGISQVLLKSDIGYRFLEMMSRGIGAARRVLLGSGNFRWLSSPATGNHRPAAAQSERMTDLGCRDIFGPDQDAFRETARKFMANEVMPHHAR